MTVCERIDEILNSRRISRRKLAIKAGIAPSSFQSAMARNRSLSFDMLIPIADVLGVSVEYLDTGIEPEPTYTNDELQLIYNSQVSSSQDLATYDKLYHLLPKLNNLGQQKAIERIEELLEVPKYRSEWRDEKDGILQNND